MPAFLARRYAAAVDVERGDDAPAAFIWRGRRYAVTDVLDHWWETAAWWMGEPAGDTGSSDTGCSDDEREFWRVEGSAGRVSAVVELCFGWSTGTWTVTAVLD